MGGETNATRRATYNLDSCMILKCHCGKATEYPVKGSCWNPGEIEKVTRWFWVPLYDGGTTWLCESCGPRALRLACELVAVTGTGDTPLSSLLRIGKSM